MHLVRQSAFVCTVRKNHNLDQMGTEDDKENSVERCGDRQQDPVV